MEIEVKAYLNNKQKTLKELTKLGCVFSKAITQDDTVFAEKTGNLEIFLSNDVFLRIRIQDKTKIILTAKKPKAKTGQKSLVKYEHEIVANSEEEIRGILNLLNFKEVVRVVKKRKKTHYKDYEICLDEIENLGTFIEIEKIGNEKDADKIQKDMLDFLDMLGVSKNDIVKKGYDILMLEKQDS